MLSFTNGTALHTFMKIVTLNVRHGGGTRAGRLLGWFSQFAADVVVMTEYRENSNSARFKSGLFEMGYKWQASSSIDPDENAVFLASKSPFVSNSQLGDCSGFRHRLLFARFTKFNLIGAYFPQGEEKRPVFDFLIDNAPTLLGEFGLILGDFNTGKPYLDEAGRTFACADCFDGLLSSGLIDAWRVRYPDRREFSWYSTAKNGFRIDHAFCTAPLNQQVTSIAYLHEPREAAATDHSALAVELNC